MEAEMNEYVLALAARQGVDLAALAGGPNPLGASWAAADPVGLRREIMEHALERVADGEFRPDRLPPMMPQVRVWVDGLKRDLQAWDPKRDDHPWFEEPWVMLIGKTGSGKTSQGIRVIMDLAEYQAERNRGFRWHIVSHREFSAQTRDFDDDPDGAIEKYKLADFLVFEDIGDFQPTPWAKDCSARLIAWRHRKRLPTFFDTNLPVDRDDALREQEQKLGRQITVLADMLGDSRLVSRLDSACKIFMPSVDYRARRGRVIR